MDMESALGDNGLFLIGEVAGTLAALACAWAVIDIIRGAIRMHRQMQNEVIVQETTSAYYRSLMPLARRIGLGLRITFEGGRRAPGWFANMHRRLSQQLSSAGFPQGLNADEYIGFVMISGFIGGILGVIYFLLDPSYGIDVSFIVGVLGGMFWQRRWLGKKKLQRQTTIRKQLPFAMDLLCLSTEAGMDFTGALATICKKLGTSPLGEEFGIMLREIQLGKTRSDAMRDLTRRVDVNEVRSVMSSLLQAEELGTPIGPVLRIQAAQQRERRGQRAEEQANKAPVKILFPLLLFMAAAFILVFGPIVMNYL